MNPKWAHHVVNALMIAFLTITLLVVVVIVGGAFFNNPPVKVESMDKPYTRPLCPGEVYMITNRITVEQPTVLFFHLSVMDTDETQNINDTQVSFLGRPHPRESAFVQTLYWKVPYLSPGPYKRVMAVRGTDGDENPLFLDKNFEIGKDCEYPTP